MRALSFFIVKLINFTGAKPALNFNPAAIELAGCLPAYSKFLLICCYIVKKTSQLIGEMFPLFISGFGLQFIIISLSIGCYFALR